MSALGVMAILLPIALALGAKASLASPPLPGLDARQPPQATQPRGRSHRMMRGQRPPIPDTDRALVQATLWDLRTGAVVVVEEEEGFPLLPRTHARTGFIHFFGPAPNRTTTMPPAPWMDPSTVVSGGNTVAQVHPLGWGY